MSFAAKLFHPKTLLDDAYEFSIILKAIGGVLECVSGIGLLFITPIQIQSFVANITRAELLENPHSFIYGHLASWASHLGVHATLFAAIYLLAHGVLKIAIVTALLFKRQWAYPAAIVIFSGFAVYQIYITFAHTSIAYALLTVYDLIVIYLVWLEYQKAKAQAAK